jgi:cytoskeletal protein CcmA (bactofilin family)
MPASPQDKVLLTCPHCGHQQREPRTAISTNCRKCGRHFRIQDVLQPAAKPVERPQEVRALTCFDCGTELKVAPSAESTMCKRCGRYVDLKDYHITSTVSKNFKTKGAFVVETKGYVLNTEAIVGNATIKGRLIGKLFAENSLTIYSTAEIKGSFKTGKLIIPSDNHFRWHEPIRVVGAEIAGELATGLKAEGTVVLKSTARLFGDVIAKNLIVESGAVVVGALRIGTSGSV